MDNQRTQGPGFEIILVMTARQPALLESLDAWFPGLLPEVTDRTIEAMPLGDARHLQHARRRAGRGASRTGSS